MEVDGNRIMVYFTMRLVTRWGKRQLYTASSLLMSKYFPVPHSGVDRDDLLRAGRFRHRIPVEYIFRIRPHRPWGPANLLYKGYFFSEGKAALPWL